jgi:hypothetical protein
MERRRLHETTLGYVLVTIIAGVATAVIVSRLPGVEANPEKRASASY